MSTLDHARHAKYFARFLEVLPASMGSQDSSRVTIAFFSVSGMDILDKLDLLSGERKDEIIDWVYSLQFVSENYPERAGIMGSSMLLADVGPESGLHDMKFGHLAMTYTGIGILLALGDDLKRLERQAIIKGVASCQKPDGSFSATSEGNENDMRFVYCAACICAMLDDWTGVDVDKMVDYIKSCVRYDYGISQHEEMESHGGTTFCALAALELSGRLSDFPETTIDRMVRWLMFRQDEGFNGRPNKPMDTCYSFWIGAALKILNAFQYTDFDANRNYLMSTQNLPVGGFAKWPGVPADPFHTYFALCGLSFIKEPGILPVMPSLNISMRAYDWMKELHSQWKEA